MFDYTWCELVRLVRVLHPEPDVRLLGLGGVAGQLAVGLNDHLFNHALEKTNMDELYRRKSEDYSFKNHLEIPLDRLLHLPLVVPAQVGVGLIQHDRLEHHRTDAAKRNLRIK